MNDHHTIVSALQNVKPGTWQYEYDQDQTRLQGKTQGKGLSKERCVDPGIWIRWDLFHGEEITFSHEAKELSLEITYCAKGRVGWQMKDGSSIYLGQGDIALHPMDCCATSTMRFPSGFYRGLTVVLDFGKMNQNKLFQELEIDLKHIQERYCRHEVYAIADNEEIHDVFYLLEKQGKENLTFQKIKIVELLMTLSQKDWTQAKTLDPLEPMQMRSIRQMHDFLVENYEKHYTIEELSKKYLINTSSLKACFKAVYGMPIAAYMKEYRMQKASGFLKDTDHTIQEIALSVGYSSQSKFSQAFKDVMHVLPNIYRKEYRNNQRR